MGDKGGDPDWYGYCLDDPVNGVDPLGLSAWLSQLVANEASKTIADNLEAQKGITWGGEGRSLLDGPMYGNWGGKNLSGGKSGGEIGDAAPVDSSDALYKQHDLAYDKIQNTPVLGDVRKTQRTMIDTADKTLVEGLQKLDGDPGTWAIPPKKGTEKSASWFRDKAIRWFE